MFLTSAMLVKKKVMTADNRKVLDRIGGVKCPEQTIKGKLLGEGEKYPRAKHSAAFYYLCNLHASSQHYFSVSSP